MLKKKLCPECKGVITEGHTEMVYELKNLTITIRNVPASVCEKCGQAYISGHVAEDVNRLVNRVGEDVNCFARTQPEIGKRHREVAIAV